MPDFSHLKKYAITKEVTAEFTFSRIEGEPSIILAPAHDVNADFQRERTAMQMALAEQMVKPKGKVGKPTTEDVIADTEKEREQDRQLIAHTCAKGWGTSPVDSAGKAVDFSAENALEFFRAIPPEMFDPMRNFASNLWNFYPERRWTEDDVAGLGNS